MNTFSSRLLYAFLFIAFFIPRVSQAQGIDQTALLTVTMTDVVSFVLADVAPIILYDDASDLQNGVSYSIPTGIAGTVTATNNYSISVVSSLPDLTFLTNTIPVSSISLQASGDNLGTTPSIALSDTPQEIISNADFGVLKTFNLTYSTAAGDTNFQGLPAGAYTTTLTYSATLD